MLGGPGWFTSGQLATYHCLTLMQSILRCGKLSALAATFSQNDERRSRQTRQDRQLRLPRIRSEAGRRRFAYRGAQLYNRLPADLLSLKHNSFKRKLKIIVKGGNVT